MRKSIALALVVTLGLVLTAGSAWARPINIYQMYLWTFGEPAAAGVLVSAAGASVTNALTATPFAITTAAVPLRFITVQCDATAFVGFSSTCGITFAASSGCVRLTATDPPRVIILQDATTAMNAAGPAAFNCVVTRLL